MKKYRIGIDIGGTFTDVILINEETGRIDRAKVPTTPEDLSQGVINGLTRIITKTKIDPQDIYILVHGTTVVTNAVIGRKGVKTGLITTKGFRDVLELGRTSRVEVYNLFIDRLTPLVPRHLRLEVSERVNYKGEILQPLDEREARAVVQKLKRAGVESIAVCFLHSYVNPTHERKVGEIIGEEQIDVSLSSEVNPEFREYERTSTVVVNAYTRPLACRYLTNLEESLRKLGVTTNLLIMQSSGGIMTSEVAKSKPVQMIESGPAAGVILATNIGGVIGCQDVISLDIGGTTAKVCLITGGRPEETMGFEVGGLPSFSVRKRGGSGYPIRTSGIYLAEIGAGGGSIAWIDPGGILHVGPQSAGASPGPVCYGMGGVEPTLTDANLLLGRINPEYFLGGEVKLDVAAAERAMKKLADLLDMDVVEAASGIIKIANGNMIRPLRAVSIERGYDPRNFTLIAFGGAGGLHAAELSQELGIPIVIIPESPGLASAYGLLMADIKHSYMRTHIVKADRADISAIEDVYRDLEEKARHAMEQEGLPKEGTLLLRFADMRYAGQMYEVNTPAPSEIKSIDDLKSLVDRFHEEHERLYSYYRKENPVEIVNLRVTAVYKVRELGFRKHKEEGLSPERALKGKRRVYVEEKKNFIECPIYERLLLKPNNLVMGPAIIEEIDSTIVIHPEQTARMDRYRNIVIKTA